LQSVTGSTFLSAHRHLVPFNRHMLSTQSADGTAPDNSPARAGIRQSSSASDRKYPYLVHRRHGLGIERGRLHARAQHLEALPAISRRKASAICVRLLLSEQRKRTLGFIGLFAERHNGLGSHGLVAGAAFGIEETQQLLQGVRIGRFVTLPTPFGRFLSGQSLFIESVGDVS